METFSRGWVPILVVVLWSVFLGVVQTNSLDSGIFICPSIYFEQNYVAFVCVLVGVVLEQDRLQN